MLVEKHGPRLARSVPIDSFAIDVLRAYHEVRTGIVCPTDWLFVATAGGKPMKPDTLVKCVRTALKAAGLYRQQTKALASYAIPMAGATSPREKPMSRSATYLACRAIGP